MSASVPAGAGGVDTDADWFEQEMRDLALGHEVAREWADLGGEPFMLCVECDEAGPDVPDWQCTRLRFLAEIRSTRAALAAAEQRADTLQTIIDSFVGHWTSHPEARYGNWHSGCSGCSSVVAAIRSRAALSSRPVQPEGKQR